MPSVDSSQFLFHASSRQPQICFLSLQMRPRRFLPPFCRWSVFQTNICAVCLRNFSSDSVTRLLLLPFLWLFLPAFKFLLVFFVRTSLAFDLLGKLRFPPSFRRWKTWRVSCTTQVLNIIDWMKQPKPHAPGTSRNHWGKHDPLCAPRLGSLGENSRYTPRLVFRI